MSVTTMTEQYVQQLYQNNAGTTDRTKNPNAAARAGKNNGSGTNKVTEQDQAAVYEPSNGKAEKPATYTKPANPNKGDTNGDLRAKLEKVYKNLSTEAKEYLETLKEKFGNIEFFVADCKSDEEMGRYFSMGQKEYTCVINPKLLEKMATDEATRAKYEEIIDGADEKIEAARAEIKEEFGEEAAEEVLSVGISIDGNGVVEYFAKLRNSNREYYEKLKEQRAEEKAEAKKAEEKKNDKKEDPSLIMGNGKPGFAELNPGKDSFWIHEDSKDALINTIREILGRKKEDTDVAAVAGETAE